jgi:RHS repeat-associated protein
LGRRSTAAINGQATSTLYDGWNPVQLQAGGVAVENRLTGLGLDVNFARTRNGVTESYLSDALGSTLELRDAAQNQTVEYSYDPYGGTTSSAASTNGIKYTGREQDLEDLYYYRNRYYKPSVGRFVSEDPIGLAGGSNLYAYGGENPINFIDPLGLAGETPKQPPGTPTIPPPERQPAPAPRGPGAGCKALFETCITGAQKCGPVKKIAAAACLALWLACEATNLANN